VDTGQLAQFGEQNFPAANFDGAILRMTEDTYDFGGDKGTYEVYPEHLRARMNISGKSGPNAGRTILAIMPSIAMNSPFAINSVKASGR
jgi:hypothetical protein